jgi:hypothetical protein
MSLVDKIPGYKEALAKEAELRNAALLDAYALCGLGVRALTLRDVLVLLGAQSTIFSEQPTREDIAAFLWLLQPNFWAWKKAGESPVIGGWAKRFERRSKRRFTKRLRNLKYEQAIIEVDEYLDAMFLDSPASSDGGDGAAFTSFAVSIINYIAEAYGWSRHEILNAPLPELYQHIKRIEKNRNPKAPTFNRISDRIKGDWLRSRNKK